MKKNMHSFNYMAMHICIAFFFITTSFAQSTDSIRNYQKYPFIVDSISISGNNITEREIITRELTFVNGDTLSYELARYNEERVYSLGLFTRVQFQPQKINTKSVLNILVDESWYIYPIPFASLKDNDWNKLSYGFNLVIKNFRGRNETLSLRPSFGYDPSFSVSYYKPSITYGSDIFFEISASYQHIANISVAAEKLHGSSFIQEAFLGQILIGQRFGWFRRLSLNIGYAYIETPFFIKGISASDERFDRFPSTGISFSYDTRDLIQFPKNGLFMGTGLQWKGMGVNNINYNIFTLDFREYRNIMGDLFSKWRFSTRLAFGKAVPFYDYSFLGHGERIRGHFNDKHEGLSSFVGSLEFYYPVVKDMQISFEWVPVIPNELLRYRTAIYAQLFGDAGVVKKKGLPLSLNQFDSGFGAGLTLLVLPYNSLRVECAFDESFNPELILDLGVSF